MEARQLPCLAGKHVLVVEDIYLEAEDVRRAVESAAGSVLGPASSIEQALWWIKRHQPDCGILDVGIGPLTTTPVAQRLNELKVPYIVATGFSREVIPPPLRSAPYLAKPFLREQLIESVLRSMCRPIAAESSTLEEPPTKRDDLGARRAALKIPHNIMAIGIGLSPDAVTSIEVDALIDGCQSETADFYAYWLGRLERLTKEQLEMQIGHARKGRRFR
jgi:CheY-like chemotaxis protein